MAAYLLFCILCLLLAAFIGGLAFAFWLVVTVALVGLSFVFMIGRLLYKAWDSATKEP